MRSSSRCVNSRPITAASCSAWRGSSSSRSMRDISTSWIVSGTDDLIERPAQHPARALAPDRAGLAERLDQLLDEERVALGLAPDQRVQLAGRSSDASTASVISAASPSDRWRRTRRVA